MIGLNTAQKCHTPGKEGQRGWESTEIGLKQL